MDVTGKNTPCPQRRHQLSWDNRDHLTLFLQGAPPTPPLCFSLTLDWHGHTCATATTTTTTQQGHKDKGLVFFGSLHVALYRVSENTGQPFSHPPLHGVLPHNLPVLVAAAVSSWLLCCVEFIPDNCKANYALSSVKAGTSVLGLPAFVWAEPGGVNRSWVSQAQGGLNAHRTESVTMGPIG